MRKKEFKAKEEAKNNRKTNEEIIKEKQQNKNIIIDKDFKNKTKEELKKLYNELKNSDDDKEKS